MMKTIIPLEKRHKKENFDCGQSLLNNYVKVQASQDVRRDLSACFVLLDDQDVVKGYYTLSAGSEKRSSFPEELIKKLPKSYEDLPTVLLGRLAVDNSVKKQGYGEILLIDALSRVASNSAYIGTLGVAVDPIDENARRFYSQYGFISFQESEKMFLPMKTIKALLEM